MLSLQQILEKSKVVDLGIHPIALLYQTEEGGAKKGNIKYEYRAERRWAEDGMDGRSKCRLTELGACIEIAMGKYLYRNGGTGDKDINRIYFQTVEEAVNFYEKWRAALETVIVEFANTHQSLHKTKISYVRLNISWKDPPAFLFVIPIQRGQVWKGEDNKHWFTLMESYTKSDSWECVSYGGSGVHRGAIHQIFTAAVLREEAKLVYDPNILDVDEYLKVNENKMTPTAFEGDEERVEEEDIPFEN